MTFRPAASSDYCRITGCSKCNFSASTRAVNTCLRKYEPSSTSLPPTSASNERRPRSRSGSITVGRGLRAARIVDEALELQPNQSLGADDAHFAERGLNRCGIAEQTPRRGVSLRREANDSEATRKSIASESRSGRAARAIFHADQQSSTRCVRKGDHRAQCLPSRRNSGTDSPLLDSKKLCLCETGSNG
jgi:hypothetical protein